jgi:2-keto-4-pentenoate hydratase/2-oxohepta-3-ene-1,7-dioic acid hydratase in catechol pathway
MAISLMAFVIWMSVCDGDWIAGGVIMPQDHRKMPGSPNCIDADDFSCDAKNSGRRSMAHWIRFESRGETGFGTVEGETIAVHCGDMFAAANPTGETLKLSDVQLSTQCQPSKMICLWNNLHQLAAKSDFQRPKEPLWFLKAPNAYWPAGRPIQRPATYAGKIIYEGELGVVIGRSFNISEAEAGDYIFGYTCVNDVTAVDLLRKDKSFDQWARAKSFDTFGVFGPVIATDVDPMKLSVKTILNGKERQNYPVADMFFPPHELVAAISKDVTLMPGDIIACGTSLGSGTMGDAHNVVDIVIDGVGTLSNVFDRVLPSPYLLGAPPRQKRICVVGAGAIGGLLAAKFALAGEDVTVIDQGAHLAAIQKDGLKLEWHDGKVHIVRMKAANKPAEAGKQDIVVLAVKAHFLDQVVRDIDSLLGPDTVVLTVQNGLPWWYSRGSAASTTIAGWGASIPPASSPGISTRTVSSAAWFIPRRQQRRRVSSTTSKATASRSANSTARRPSASRNCKTFSSRPG